MIIHPYSPVFLLMEIEFLRLDDHGWLDVIPPYIRPWLVPAVIALLLLLLIRTVWRVLTHRMRRRGEPTIHPKLQKYNVDHARLDRERRKLATRIAATSTGTRLAGFRIVRQVDAVFVEGHRTPEEALIALKAAAAERGANALVNVHTERSTAGKCAASGDAVIAAPPAARPPQPPAGRPPAPPDDREPPVSV